MEGYLQSEALLFVEQAKRLLYANQKDGKSVKDQGENEGLKQRDTSIT